MFALVLYLVPGINLLPVDRSECRFAQMRFASLHRASFDWHKVNLAKVIFFYMVCQSAHTHTIYTEYARERKMAGNLGFEDNLPTSANPKIPHA